MDSSRKAPFDAGFALFAANYLFDGVLTWFAVTTGNASEANPWAQTFTPQGFLWAKVLGLASIVLAATLAVRISPGIRNGVLRLWRAASLFFASVCLVNLITLTGGAR